MSLFMVSGAHAKTGDPYRTDAAPKSAAVAGDGQSGSAAGSRDRGRSPDRIQNIPLARAGSATLADATDRTRSAADANARPGRRVAASLSEQTSKQLALGLLAGDTPTWYTLTVKRGDTLSQLFLRSGLADKAWMAVLDLGAKVAPLKKLHPGDTLEIHKTASGELAGLRYPMGPIKTLAVTREHGHLRARIAKRPVDTRQIKVAGRVAGSLSKSLKDAGIPAAVASQLARIYSYRLKLSRRVHAGDRFSLIYRAGYIGGQRVKVGPIVAASFDTRRSTYEAFRAVDDDGNARYYDPSGHSYEPSISRHPVDYSRISSPFSHSRMNPVLHIRRPHTGVDMAARRGTPVHAAANGTVKFVGRNGGYGRLIELRHFDHYTTRYGHLSRYAKGLHDGERVSQGEVIGYVGESGVATGPHLHFEVRKDGVPHNPMTMKLPDGKSLPADQLAYYKSRIRPLIARLDPSRGPAPNTASANFKLASVGQCGRADRITGLARPPSSALDDHLLGDLFCVVASNGN